MFSSPFFVLAITKSWLQYRSDFQFLGKKQQKFLDVYLLHGEKLITMVQAGETSVSEDDDCPHSKSGNRCQRQLSQTILPFIFHG